MIDTHIFNLYAHFVKGSKSESNLVKKSDTNISSTNPTKCMNRCFEFVTNKAVSENIPYLYANSYGYKHYNDMFNDSKELESAPGGGRRTNFMTPVNQRHSQQQHVGPRMDIWSNLQPRRLIVTVPRGVRPGTKFVVVAVGESML